MTLTTDDLSKIKTLIGPPVFALARESSDTSVYAINPIAGTKRHISKAENTTNAKLGYTVKVVADGDLAAYRAVT